jgi:hypothetical protein
VTVRAKIELRDGIVQLAWLRRGVDTGGIGLLDHGCIFLRDHLCIITNSCFIFGITTQSKSVENARYPA